MSQRSKCCLIGVPDHQGVILVGGRIGAASGPRAFRRAFGRLKGRDGVHESLTDLGDVGSLSSDIHRNHRQAADRIREGHASAGLSIVVGGGHDHGYSHLLGLSEALKAKNPAARLGCINIDAHLDVRKEIGSGSPFYLAMESGTLDPKRFVEFGIQRHCNARELWEYVEARGVEVAPFERLRHGKAPAAFEEALARLAGRCDAVAVSLDLDAAAAAFAPGVSAPQAEGFTSSEIVEMCEIAGRSAQVASLGIFELNPEHDPDERTAKLAATAAYHFICERR